MSRPRILYLGACDGSFVDRRKFAGVSRYAYAQGWEVVPFSTLGLPYADIPGLLKRWKPEGCIVGCGGGVYFPRPRLFGNVPVVYLVLSSKTPGAAACATVEIDDEAVVRTAMRELEGWRPAAVGVVECRNAGNPWSRARSRLFRTAAKHLGKTCGAFAALAGEDGAAYSARLAAWLAAQPRPFGVFAVSDGPAVDVLNACRAAHLHVPKDVAIVGVDDSDEAAGAEKPLSSIRIDFEYTGFLAAKMLGEKLGALGRLPQPGIAHHVIGPIMVVRRKSTSGRGRHLPCIEEAVNIIRRDACDGLTARKLAASFPGTRRHFDRRFREATGHSALDEILHVRMERAFNILAGTDVPVSAVSDFCGFGSYQELDRLFRARCGVSMSEWRRANTHSRTSGTAWATP